MKTGVTLALCRRKRNDCRIRDGESFRLGSHFLPLLCTLFTVASFSLCFVSTWIMYSDCRSSHLSVLDSAVMSSYHSFLLFSASSAYVNLVPEKFAQSWASFRFQSRFLWVTYCSFHSSSSTLVGRTMIPCNSIWGTMIAVSTLSGTMDGQDENRIRK